MKIWQLWLIALQNRWYAKEHFPDSPLREGAVYVVEKCYYDQLQKDKAELWEFVRHVVEDNHVGGAMNSWGRKLLAKHTPKKEGESSEQS